MQSSVLVPIIFSGGSRLMFWGSWEALAERASTASRRPGIIMPPKKFFFLSMTEMVLEVTRSGASTDTSYNFEPAFDEDDNKMVPKKWKEETPIAEELCQPPTEDEIDERGYSSSDE